MSKRTASFFIVTGLLALSSTSVLAKPPSKVTHSLTTTTTATSAPATDSTRPDPAASTTTTSSTTSTTTDTSAAATPTMDENTRLASALTSALQRSGVAIPAGGLGMACAGFTNLGGCLGTLHAAQNLSVPGGFDALKPLVTGPNAVPLGEAIKQLKPSVDSMAEETKASQQADADIAATRR